MRVLLLTARCAALSIAIINVGLPRTVLHPSIAAGFALMRSGLEAAHSTETFLFLSTAVDQPIHARRWKNMYKGQPDGDWLRQCATEWCAAMRLARRI